MSNLSQFFGGGSRLLQLSSLFTISGSITIKEDATMTVLAAAGGGGGSTEGGGAGECALLTFFVKAQDVLTFQIGAGGLGRI